MTSKILISFKSEGSSFFLAEGQIRSQIKKKKKTAEAKGLFLGFATKSIDFFVFV